MGLQLPISTTACRMVAEMGNPRILPAVRGLRISCWAAAYHKVFTDEKILEHLFC